MANINGNITDDLFRQASDHYPLRTDSADWSRLSDDLEKDPSLILPSLNEEGDGRRRRGFLWLFFLVPLAVAGYFVWPGGTHTRDASIVDASIIKGQNTHSETTTAVEDHIAKTGPADGISSDAAQGTIADEDANTKAHTGFGAVAGSQKNSGSTVGKTTPATTTNEHAGIKIPTTTGKDTRTEGNNTKNYSAGSDNAGSTNIVVNNAAGTPGTAGTAAIENDPRLSGIYVQRAAITEGVSLNIDVRANTNSNINPNTNINTNTGPNNDVVSSTAPAAPPKKMSVSKHYFYAGLVVAPDLSTIKFQNVKSVGTTFGVLFGYSLNARFSLESGIYLDKKKYYTEGQYFNKEKVPALWNYKLLNVDGTCNMVEIPVNLRYNLNPTAKNKWFVTAGLSTYLMFSEGYNYQVLRYGNPYNVAPVTYMNPMQNWFSIANLSVGYEQKLGKIGNLRLEPYLRVPLSGVGTGSLPIMSAGLNIGITRAIR
jgi:hypothetical protein